jgi:hypothetical protein
LLIGAKENIGEAVVIDIADGDTCAIKKIAEGIWVKFFVIGYVIGEVDTCLRGL